jgi:hypothetical protein
MAFVNTQNVIEAWSASPDGTTSYFYRTTDGVTREITLKGFDALTLAMNS